MSADFLKGINNFQLCERVDRGLDELRVALERHISKEGHAEIDKVTEQAFNVCRPSNFVA